MNWEEFDWLIEAALREDQAHKDVTSGALVPEGLDAAAEVVVNEEGRVCGLPLAGRLVQLFDPDVSFRPLVDDGAEVEAGTVAATFEGRAVAILAVERSMLNFLQRLSGVATLTARYVRALAGTGARVLDTRKTTPGWRKLDKYAVRCGGGVNHRMDLREQVLIKDNHLRAVLESEGGPSDPVAAVSHAVRLARDACGDKLVEVEVEGQEEMEAAVAAGADVVMLDNMSPEEVARAIRKVRGLPGGSQVQIEASGSITLENVRWYGEAGADRISVGALTHSAPALDISVRFTTRRGQ